MMSLTTSSDPCIVNKVLAEPPATPETKRAMTKGGESNDSASASGLGAIDLAMVGKRVGWRW